MESIVHHPFAYPFGPIQVTGFGLAVLLAFLVSQYIAEHELRRRGHDASAIPDLIIAAVVGGLLGAKLYYVVLNGNIADFFSRSGFVFWGGLMGGTVAVLAMAQVKKLNLLRIMDVGGICVAAAYAVGRTGCWAVGDDYGKPWNSAFAVLFPEGAPPSTVGIMQSEFGVAAPEGVSLDTVLAVHPTQIYEVVMGLAMFFLLWRMRGHKHAEGWLFGMYCILAGVERFVIEFFRAKDDHGIFGPLTVAQLIAIGFVVAGLVLMAALSKTGPGRPGIYAGRTTLPGTT